MQEGTSKVIYAYHPSDPRSPDYFPKHTVKGSRSLMLLNTGKNEPNLPANVTFLDILNNQVRSSSSCLIILSPLKCQNRKPKDPLVLVTLFCYVHKFAISKSKAFPNVMFSNHAEVSVAIRDGEIYNRIFCGMLRWAIRLV